MTTETFKKLKKLLGRWFNPTVARHKLHVEVCERLECQELIEPFSVFAGEVLNAPVNVRDDMLNIQPVEPYEPFMRYPAYIEPTKAEQKLDFYSEAMGRKLR